MSRAKKPPPDPDNGLHVLNVAYGLGVMFGLVGPKSARPLLVGQPAAVRDQYYRGLLEGRNMRGARGKAEDVDNA